MHESQDDQAPCRRTCGCTTPRSTHLVDQKGASAMMGGELMRASCGFSKIEHGNMLLWRDRGSVCLRLTLHAPSLRPTFSRAHASFYPRLTRHYLASHVNLLYPCFSPTRFFTFNRVFLFPNIFDYRKTSHAVHSCESTTTVAISKTISSLWQWSCTCELGDEEG